VIYGVPFSCCMNTTLPDYKQLYEASEARNNQLQVQLAGLQQQLSQLQKMIFGSRQERFVPAETNPAQLSLGIQADADAVAACSVTEVQKISYTKTSTTVEQKQQVHPGRMKLPQSLRREVVVIEPAADITGCKKMGEEITEVLEYQPGELYVKQYRRVKYARPGGEGVMIGELPLRPLEKAMAGPGLLAQVVIDKYADHLPLYRQMQRFERNGIKLPYSTLTDWVSATCMLIAPLYEALKAEVLQSNYLHADETPIKVLDKDKKGETHRGYYWVYHNSIQKLVLFDYREGRSREGPSDLLKNFTGYLQTDGYNAYDIFDGQNQIRHIHCMAHARRMFNDALDNDKSRAEYAMGQIQHLYAIERRCGQEELSYAQIKQVRQQEAAPILTALGRWMKEQYMQVLPKSAIGKALAYSIERWDKLSHYTEDGMLNIDNNPVENSIRPVAIGRKNYLFAGSHEAAKRSAMLYSLIGTCKLHGIEPFAWLKNTLEIMPTHPINKIKELLPHYSR